MQKKQPHRKFSQLSWDIECLSRNPSLLSKSFPLSAKALRRTYPMRMLRYWFIYHFLRIEHERLSKPINVCEAGIGEGQMLQFMNSVAAIPGIDPVKWSSWTGVDYRVKQDALAGLGYTRLDEQNIEQSDSWMSEDYDAVVLLHVLEHLYFPETAIEKIVPRMKPGSVLIGGLPSVPDFCAKIREPKIRANPNSNGHVSAFSPARVRRIADEHGLQLDFLSGAFFLRASGFFLEDRAWWLRLNLAFGALVPPWPGEIYWVMRKPAAG
jgi:SAM-dependent methyltransferase